jgi:hypothetical protein
VRKLLITLAILAGLLVAADFGMKAVAEGQAAKALQKSLRLSSKPSVSIQGFPFLTHLFSGRFPSVDLEDRRFVAQNVPFDRALMTLRDVRFSSSDLLGGRGGRITVSGGNGSATITGAALTKALRDQGADVTVSFEDEKARVSSSALGGESAEARLRIHDGQLVLHSALPGSVLSLTIPQVVRGVRYTGVRIDGHTAVLAFTIPRTTFTV